MRDLKLRKCDSCGALVKVINDCHCKCEINCCDEIKKNISPNIVLMMVLLMLELTTLWIVIIILNGLL